MKLICETTGIEGLLADQSGYLVAEFRHPLADRVNSAIISSLTAEGLAGALLMLGQSKGYFTPPRDAADARVANLAIQAALPTNDLRRLTLTFLTKTRVKDPCLTLANLASDSEAAIKAMVGQLKNFCYGNGDTALRRDRAELARKGWAADVANEEVEAAMIARLDAARKVRRMSDEQARKTLARAVANLNDHVKATCKAALPKSYEPFFKESLCDVRPLLENCIELGSLTAGSVLGYWEELTIRPIKSLSGKLAPAPMDFGNLADIKW